MLTDRSPAVPRRFPPGPCGFPRPGVTVIVAALLIALSAIDARAGAWTQPPGSIYAKIEAVTRSTGDRYDGAGETIELSSGLSTATYEIRQVRGYAEVGIVPGVTGIASVAWQRLRVEEEAVYYQTDGFSDARLGARFGILDEEFVSAAQIEVKIPTGYDANEFPSLGNGDPDLGASIHFGVPFPRGYLGLDFGYNFRAGDLANEIPFSVEVGGRLVSRLQARAVLRGRRAVREEEELPDPNFDPSQVDSRNLDAAFAVVYAAGPRWDVEAGITHTLNGRNTLTGTEFSLGVAWHR